MLRKAGQILKAHPVKSTLAGAGGILGLAGVLKTLSPKEQEMVLNEAIPQEDENQATVYGVTGGSLMAAAALLALTEDNPERMHEVVTTSPRRTGLEADGVVYQDPMGDLGRAEAISKGHHRISAPRPRGVLRRR